MASIKRYFFKRNNLHGCFRISRTISSGVSPNESETCKYFHLLKWQIILNSIHRKIHPKQKMYLSLLLFQSPWKFILFVVTISIMTRLPRFFTFELKEDGTDYRISDMLQDPIYIRFSSYWDDIVVTGLIPLLLLMYFHSKMYLKVKMATKYIYN